MTRTVAATCVGEKNRKRSARIRDTAAILILRATALRRRRQMPQGGEAAAYHPGMILPPRRSDRTPSPGAAGPGRGAGLAAAAPSLPLCIRLGEGRPGGRAAGTHYATCPGDPRGPGITRW
eukprot:546840-Hanusia_phi.AAC.2